MADALKPAHIVSGMIDAGAAKAQLGPVPLLARSALAGALLGVATTLAFTALAQTGLPIVGALIFPVGFAIIVVLGLDLVTGSFALLPLAVIAGRASVSQMLANWGWTLLGNLLGALAYAALMWVALTSDGTGAGGPIADKLRAAVAMRTAGYAALGGAGLLTVFVRAMLCNWLVCLGVVMGMSSTSVGGKVLACWLPIVLFFAQGFEHAVVNMSLFPLGLMLGADATVSQFLLWNELPVVVGNVVGGLAFTGLALLASYSGEQAGVRVSAAPAE